jgi:hypothetical protein
MLGWHYHNEPIQILILCSDPFTLLQLVEHKVYGSDKNDQIKGKVNWQLLDKARDGHGWCMKYWNFLHKQEREVILQRSQHIFQVHSLPYAYPKGINVYLLHRQFNFNKPNHTFICKNCL